MSKSEGILYSFRAVLAGNILLLFITWILLTFGGSLTQNFSSLYFRKLGANDGWCEYGHKRRRVGDCKAGFCSLEKRGRVMGSYLFFSYLGGMFGAFLGGHIYKAMNFMNFLLASWILLSLGIIVYTLFRKLDIGISPLHA